MDAFKISCMGAKSIGKSQTADKLLDKINGLEDESIICACKLAGFDVCIRASSARYKPVENINPDKVTINNIRIMVKRCLLFWKQYGPIMKDGFTFEGAFADIVTSGNGDYLSQDTLWSIKVSKSTPTSKQSLELLINYLLGLESVHNEFNAIKFIGIYNPRLNMVYRYCIANIPEETVQKVRKEVISYDSTLEVPPAKIKKGVYQKETVSVREAQRILKVKQEKVYALIKSGKLSAFMEGNHYEICRRDVLRYRRKNRLCTGLLVIVWLILLVIKLIVY